MTTNKVRRAIAAALCLACLILVVIGGINQPKKDKTVGQTILNDLRAKSLLNATGEGVVESYVNIAKKEAQEKAKAEKAGMAAIREAVAQAEADTRAKYENSEFSAAVSATPELLDAVMEYNVLLSTFGGIEAAAKQAYIDEHYHSLCRKPVRTRVHIHASLHRYHTGLYDSCNGQGLQRIYGTWKQYGKPQERTEHGVCLCRL